MNENRDNDHHNIPEALEETLREILENDDQVPSSEAYLIPLQSGSEPDPTTGSLVPFVDPIKQIAKELLDQRRGETQDEFEATAAHNMFMLKVLAAQHREINELLKDTDLDRNPFGRKILERRAEQALQQTDDILNDAAGEHKGEDNARS